jgi:hypothetical protein
MIGMRAMRRAERNTTQKTCYAIRAYYDVTCHTAVLADPMFSSKQLSFVFPFIRRKSIHRTICERVFSECVYATGMLSIVGDGFQSGYR